ncbi:hypothetical protein SAMN05421748_13713 [Paractinoplanes atraurantiacus]|uniref:PH domain-containing protein n=2 Tax=Paractinoplanes atraurantiacus TaxID=1036182 RepID=A0A285KFM5_9ACTN|nr:hypothetical protein SAMN05421748_13713 [Actinoplanes atraurantiacus]
MTLWVDRRRRLFVAAVVVPACALVSVGGDLGVAAVPLVGGVLLVSIVLSVAAYAAPRPEVLFARPGVPAFETGADLSVLALVPGLVALSSAWVAGGIHARASDWSFQLLTGFLGVWALAFCAAVAWRSPTVRLRSDGVEARQLFGGLFVPWEARPTVADMRPYRLALTYGRPELVRRRGWWPLGPHGIPVTGVDAGFLGQVIQYYGQDAGRRAGIGTGDERGLLTGV